MNNLMIIPWEDRKNISFIKTIFWNFKELFFNPKNFFNNIKANKSWKAIIIWILMICLIISIFSFLWNDILGISLNFLLFDERKNLNNINYLSLFLKILNYLFEIFFISSVLFFIIYLLKKKLKFEEIFKIIGYSYSANVLTILPFIGSFFGYLYFIILSIIGIKYKGNLNYATAFFIIICAIMLLFLTMGLSAIFMYIIMQI